MGFSDQLAFTNRENAFMRHCGISIIQLDESCCQARLRVEGYCRNTGETVHGGLLYTMADCAVSAFARALGGKPVTLSGSLHYFANVTGGEILAEAALVRRGKTIGVFRVQITSGEKLLAEGTFTTYHTKP